MKDKIMHAGVLVIVFLVALVGFGYLMNRENMDMSADIGSATLPRISFETEGYEVNSLPGYVTEMEIPTMRDTVTPVSNLHLKVKISSDSEVNDKVIWQLYPLSGGKSVQEKEAELTNGGMDLYFDDGDLLEEKVLKITLQSDGRDVYYYTRVKSAADCNYKACIDFVQELFNDIEKKENTDELASYLESSSDTQGNLNHVTIRSSLDTVLWNGIYPLISGVSLEVKECNEAITSIALEYRAQCIEGEEVASYNVQEFFQVRIVGEKKYLMDYDRKMARTLDGSAQMFSNNMVLAGCSPETLDYRTNENETIAAFVQDDELWSYDSKANLASLIFRFGSDENTDRRNDYHRYQIEILSVADEGNIIFNVIGYMNRGAHEGQVGVATYLYDAEKKAVIEKAFVPSTRGYYYMKNELGKCVYYGEESQTLYVMIDGNLYSVNLADETRAVLARGLVEGQYVVSQTGMMIAYQEQGGELNRSTKITVLDMQSGESFDVNAEAGTYIRPMGFMNTDFVYGMLRPEDEGKNAADVTIAPMYQLKIIGKDQKELKTYSTDGTWIIDGKIDENMLTLNRVVKSGESYVAVAQDYITNNEENTKSNIQLDHYSQEGIGTCQGIVFAKVSEIVSPKILKPQLALKDKALTVQFDDSEHASGYYTFAKGTLYGVYEKASGAIAAAYESGGTAVTAKGAYLYERGNLESAYEVDGMDCLVMENGETTMEACVRKILQKEGADVSKAGAIREGEYPDKVLGEALGTEGFDLTGCTVDQVLYLIGKETPVIAVTGVNAAVLLTGYNKTSIVYLNPVDGTRQSMAITDFRQIMEANGNIFIGYKR